MHGDQIRLVGVVEQGVEGVVGVVVEVHQEEAGKGGVDQNHPHGVCANGPTTELLPLPILVLPHPLRGTGREG